MAHISKESIMKNTRTGSPIYGHRSLKSLLLGSTLLVTSLSFRASGADRRTDEVRLNADRIVFSESRKTIKLDGRVKVIDNEHTVVADHMLVTLDEQRKLAALTATGNVVFVSGDLRATGRSASFVPKTDLLTLTGDPVLQRQSDTVRGAERIVYNVKTKTVSTEGNQRTTISVSKESLREEQD
jgi:lipopolysaccharide transport protein LptA